MKIGFLTRDLSTRHGWGRFAYEIITRLPAFGIEPVVLTVRGKPADAVADINVLPCIHSWTFDNGILKPVGLALDRAGALSAFCKCEAIHCLAEPLAPFASSLAGGTRPLIQTIHGTYAVKTLDPIWRSVDRRSYERTHVVFSVSHYTANRLVERLPSLVERVRVAPPGVASTKSDTPVPHSEREHALLCVGGVQPRTGTLETIDAMAMVVRRFPKARLYIAGKSYSKRYETRVRKRIREKHLTDHVSWLGPIDSTSLQQLYRRVKGLVMPSINDGAKFEGFGLVHLEAASFGTPSIGSFGCGSEEAIQHGKTGFLIEQRDVSNLSEAMSRLLDSQFEWNAMSVNAWQFAQSMSWERTVEDYLRVYRDIHSQSGNLESPEQFR